MGIRRGADRPPEIALKSLLMLPYVVAAEQTAFASEKKSAGALAICPNSLHGVIDLLPVSVVQSEVLFEAP